MFIAIHFNFSRKGLVFSPVATRESNDENTVFVEYSSNRVVVRLLLICYVFQCLFVVYLYLLPVFNTSAIDTGLFHLT